VLVRALDFRLHVKGRTIMGRQFKKTTKLKRKARYKQRVKDRIKEKIKASGKKAK
jgi:hypothetical protein